MNENLAKAFDQMAIQKKKERYRALAYINAASSIRSHQSIILSGAQAQKDIKGIGKSIAAKIDEILATGTLSVIEERPEAEKEKDRVTQLFEGIHGVGPVTAEKWYQMGYKTLEDLVKIYNQMTDAQKLGYHYYHHLQRRIPRSEMDQLAGIITEAIQTTGAESMICGSYRRGEESSGDIDCLIKGTSTVDINRILEALIKTGIMVGHLATGSAKYMGICRIDKNHCVRRIDLLIVAEESWPYATLYFTGSKKLNVQMRSKALTLGMSMNEHEMVGNGKNHPARSEQDIFKMLGMKYLEPTQRSL